MTETTPTQERDSLQKACQDLLERGYEDLSRRLFYLASQEDLEPDEKPISGEAALCFAHFVSDIQVGHYPVAEPAPDYGYIDLGSRPDGELFAQWRFPDNERALVVSFYDEAVVRYTAADRKGNTCVSKGTKCPLPFTRPRSKWSPTA